MVTPYKVPGTARPGAVENATSPEPSAGNEDLDDEAGGLLERAEVVGDVGSGPHPASRAGPASTAMTTTVRARRTLAGGILNPIRLLSTP